MALNVYSMANNTTTIPFPGSNVIYPGDPQENVVDIAKLRKSKSIDIAPDHYSYAAEYRPVRACNTKAAEPVYDPYMVKGISDYLVSLNQPWAYRLNAIWCLGVTSGCRISAMVRVGNHGKNYDPKQDVTPLYIKDVLETPTQFKTHVLLHERKTGKDPLPNLTPFAKRAIALYLTKCRPNFEMDEPLFNGRKFKHQAIEEKSVNDDFAKVKKALNIKTNFSTHTMRKTFSHFSVPVISKLRMDGTLFLDDTALNVIRVSTCHYDNSLTKQYAGWTDVSADAARQALSNFYDDPSTVPMVNRLYELAANDQEVNYFE